jgi:predicted transcriptional regulator
MGRAKELNTDVVYDLFERGVPRKEIAQELGISTSTLSARLADIQHKQGLLIHYRTVQNLHLTELQARVLEAITDEKIQEAPLRDLVLAFKVLKDKETEETSSGKLKGLVGYLIQLEKEELGLATTPQPAVIEAPEEYIEDISNDSWLPDL